MTTLLAPVVGQPEDQARDHAECGALNATAVAQTYKSDIAIYAPDNANAAALVAALTAQGIPAQRASGNAADLVAEYLQQNYYVIALVHCTPYAVPCPPNQASATHWITIYSDVDPNLYYQCWTASYQTLANLSACSLVGDGYHVIVPAKTLPSPPSPVETNSPLTILGG